MCDIKVKSVKCPTCNRKLNPEWGETGPNPSTKTYVRKCDRCGCLISHHELIQQSIKLNQKRLQFLKEVHRVWPESLEMVFTSINYDCTYQYQDEFTVRNYLISNDLW